MGTNRPYNQSDGQGKAFPKYSGYRAWGALSHWLTTRIGYGSVEEMRVHVNGEPREFDGPLTVAGLVAKLGLDARKIAIERNLEIVPRSAYGGTPVSDGDRLEIVNFVGGG